MLLGCLGIIRRNLEKRLSDFVSASFEGLYFFRIIQLPWRKLLFCVSVSILEFINTQIFLVLDRGLSKDAFSGLPNFMIRGEASLSIFFNIIDYAFDLTLSFLQHFFKTLIRGQFRQTCLINIFSL